MPLALLPAVCPVPGDFPLGLPAPQRARGPAGPAVAGLGLAGDGVAGAGAAEAVGLDVAEVAGGGRDPHDDLFGGGGAAAERDTQTAALNARLKRIDNAQNSKILELEELAADPAAAAMRARIGARFAELHAEREQIETQLKALERTTPTAADPTLLDQLPLAGDIFNDLPAALKTRLFQAFDIEVSWNKPARQATVRIEITEATLQAIPAILDPTQDGYHDTTPETSQPTPTGHLLNTPGTGSLVR
jgi:hypothetical protein